MVNYLGEGNAVKFMIDSLNKGISWISMSDDYVDLIKFLNSFYDSILWHRWMAILRREFFSTPPAAASTIITVGVITVLTLIKTVCSILQVTGSSS